MTQSQLLLLTISLIINSIHSHVHHECNHDHASHEITTREMHQNYDNHPYDKSIPSTKRSLIATASNPQPIRIRPYYDPNTISSKSGLTATEINYIKQLVSSTVTYYQQFVNVHPVSGSLKHHRQCSNYYPSDFGQNCIQYYQQDTCGSVIVPDSHYGADLVYNYNRNNNSAQFVQGGNGVADADLIIYVSFGLQGSCGGNTLAYATGCFNDQYGRPIGGTINFCPSMFDGDTSTETWRKDAVTTLHEITHVMIMSDSLWTKFRDINGDIISDTTQTVNDHTYITTPKVKEWAQLHYGCDSDILVPGLPLEDNGGAGSAGSHWEEKYTNSDYMGSTIYAAQTYVSEATLKLMEDSGWYYVDYRYSDPFYWGKDEGCTFFGVDCITDDKATWPQYFCDSVQDSGCSYDHGSPASCQIYRYGNLPENMQYFTDSTIGGPQNSQFCPFRQPYTTTGLPKDFEGECIDERGNGYNMRGQYASSTFGINSRCVDITSGGYGEGRCFQHSCYGYNNDTKQWSGVNIELANNEQIQCDRGDAYTSKDSSNFRSISISCPNVDTICGESSKPFQCKWGNWNDELKKCICNVGYTGDTCSDQERSITSTAIAANTLTIQGPDGMIDAQPTPSSDQYKVCLTNMGRSYLSGTYEYYKMHNFKPSYRATIGSNTFYMFWDIFDHQWEIYKSMSSSSVYASCQTTEWNGDLAACSGEWTDGVNGQSNYCGLSINNGNPVRSNGENTDSNTLKKEITQETTTNDTKHAFTDRYIEFIIGGCLLFAVCMGCICCAIFVYKMKNKRHDQVSNLSDDDSINDIPQINLSVIKEEEIDGVHLETDSIYETDLSLSLR